MKDFVEKNLPDKKLNILDLGSKVIKGQEALGSYRQFIDNNKWKYTGADTDSGVNVDVVLYEQYKFPFKDEAFDVVISGQTLEHIEYPWVWMRELARVLKKGGLCCIVAPAVIHEHKYPIDTYRYYPDGMRALAKWSGLEPIEVKRSVATRKMEDTYLVAKKARGDERHKRTLEFYERYFDAKIAKFNVDSDLPEYFAPMIGDKKEVNIAELAAGPVCTIGNRWKDIKVNMYASDVLQKEYEPLWQAHKTEPLVKVEYQDMEHLTYTDQYFDIVHCANALDHTLDPKCALREMLRVTKPGGWIYLRHMSDQRKKYRGMHEWDMNEVEGECIFSGPRGKFSLSEFGDWKTYVGEREAIISILQKN